MTAEPATMGAGSEGDKGGRDADTQEFSEAELASFAEQSRLQTYKNGDVNSPWARLVSLDKCFSNIELSGDEVSLGRADVVKATGEDDMHVSKVHCKIWKNMETGSCYIRNLSHVKEYSDLSYQCILVLLCKFLSVGSVGADRDLRGVNGTSVQDKPLAKDQQVALQQGDEISFGPRTSGCPLFVFQIFNGVHPGHQKRGVEVEADSGADASKEGGGHYPDAKKTKMMESIDTFRCSICLNIWHDVISVTPCLHSFCNSCFSDWYRKSCRDRTECKCPQCRGSVSSVSRNHTLRSLVEDLLKEDPSLCRSSEDIIQMEKSSLFQGGSESQMQFGKTRSSWMGSDIGDPYDASGAGDDTQNSESLSSDEEEDDDDVDNFECFQCVADGGPFHCPMGQTHLVCASCGRLYPERYDVENVKLKCELCLTAYCRTYIESQSHATADSVRCPKIQQLSEQVVMDMPSRTHHGNIYEQEVTRRYLTEQGLSVQAVLRDWLERLDSGEADQHPFYILFKTRVTSNSAVCGFCADEVFANLLDRFRTCVPKTELPPDAAGRSDCWYGYECRTQHHKEAHARKLNHVCEPSRQSSRRSSAVHL